MLKTHHRFFRLLFQLSDASVVATAWALAYWVRFFNPPAFLTSREVVVPFQEYIPALLGLIFLYFLSLQISGAYKSWRLFNILPELIAVSRASVLAFVVFIALTHFIAREDYSRAVLGLFAVFATFGLIAGRLLLRFGLRILRRRGSNLRSVVVVGDGVLADQIIRKIQMRPELGLRIAGFVQKGRASQLLPKPLSDFDSLTATLQRLTADQLIVCLRNEDASHVDAILEASVQGHVQVRIVPDVSQYAVLGMEIEDFDGIPMVAINQSPLHGWNAVMKRASDILYAGVALILFSPLMLFIAILVKWTSKGPIFYSQERMGLDGVTFPMWKFRSMRTDAEAQTGAVWASKQDSRVTWIGGILRKTSLDELPQLFNVLMGQMSCVGPRPERPVFVDKFKSEIPGYMLRHKVKAGMTGWAQINGFRGNTSLEGRIDADLYYINHWSLGLDLKIMFMTIFKGFVAPHAY
jgi:Undecaprenyl-phosphate glucose phosphotransferase